MRLPLILLACVLHVVTGQYQDGEIGGGSQRAQSPIPVRSIRFQRPAGKPIGPGQALLANQRARRPIPLRSKGIEDSLGPGVVGFPGARPLRTNLPSGPAQQQQQQSVKPVTEESYEEEEKPRDDSREPDEPQDDEASRDEESDENFARTVANVANVGLSRSSGFQSSSGVAQQQGQQQGSQYRPFPSGSGPGGRSGAGGSSAGQYRTSSKPTKPRKQPTQLIEEQQTTVSKQTKPSKTSAATYDGRGKKPVAQTIRRYRHDNEDGSITWGFENDDGSYKEEIIGVDCITRGKYGYIDADGYRREYTYETGIKCDEAEREEDEENGFVDYQENKIVLPNGKTVDLSSMGKKQARRPGPIY